MQLPREACRSALSRNLRLVLISSAVLVALTAEAQVNANPTNLAFGNVQVGTKSTLPVVLTNNGSSTVAITKGLIQGPGFSVNVKLPITLNPGQNFPLNVTFAPHASNNYSATISGLGNSGLLVSVPTTGTGTQQSYYVNLSWNATPAPPDIVGYNVYRGLQSGGPYGKLNSTLDSSTAYTDSSVASGTTYYYVTTSVDTSGMESQYSNESQASIP